MITERGYAATTAVVMIALSALAMNLVVALSSYMYIDSVGRREARIQQRLNDQACLDGIDLARAKGYGDPHSSIMPEFGCR